MHLVSSHSNDVGLTALHLEPFPKGPGGTDVAETFYLVDLADSTLATELKEAGKSVVYQVRHASLKHEHTEGSLDRVMTKSFCVSR